MLGLAKQFLVRGEMKTARRMMSMTRGRVVEDVFIVSCARTPLGSMGGVLQVHLFAFKNALNVNSRVSQPPN